MDTSKTTKHNPVAEAYKILLPFISGEADDSGAMSAIEEAVGHLGEALGEPSAKTDTVAEEENSTMKVKDFIAQDVDIDVYDDVCEELGVAFIGPIQLTDEGKAEFADVLELEVALQDDSVIVKIDDPAEEVWQRRLARAKEFFEAAAGYCAHDDYDKWFDASAGN